MAGMHGQEISKKSSPRPSVEYNPDDFIFEEDSIYASSRMIQSLFSVSSSVVSTKKKLLLEQEGIGKMILRLSLYTSKKYWVEYYDLTIILYIGNHVKADNVESFSLWAKKNITKRRKAAAKAKAKADVKAKAQVETKKEAKVEAIASIEKILPANVKKGGCIKDLLLSVLYRFDEQNIFLKCFELTRKESEFYKESFLKSVNSYIDEGRLRVVHIFEIKCMNSTKWHNRLKELIYHPANIRGKTVLPTRSNVFEGKDNKQEKESHAFAHRDVPFLEKSPISKALESKGRYGEKPKADKFRRGLRNMKSNYSIKAFNDYYYNDSEYFSKDDFLITLIEKLINNIQE